MRSELPEGCSMIVTKNRLLRVAVDNMAEEQQQRWQGLRGQKGMQARCCLQCLSAFDVYFTALWLLATMRCVPP